MKSGRSALLLIAVIAVLLSSCGASSQSLVDEENEEIVLTTEDYIKPSTDARQRMLDWFDAEDEDSEALPPYFAGTYICWGSYIKDNGKLVICTTELNDEIQKTFIEACGTENILFSKVKYSRKELLDAVQAVSLKNSSDEEVFSPSFWIDSEKNQVVVIVQERDLDDLQALHEQYPCIYVDKNYGVLKESRGKEYSMRPDVTMTCDYPSYSYEDQSVFALLDNQSEKSLILDDVVRVEVLIDENWYEVPWRKDLGVAAIQINFPAKRKSLVGTSLTQDTFLGSWNYHFTEGEYRLCVYYRGGDNPGNGLCVVRAGFSIDKQAKNGYCPIEEQSRNGIIAARDGCVVIGGDKKKNDELIQRFMERFYLRGTFRLRIVDPWRFQVTDLTIEPYNGGVRMDRLRFGKLETRWYYFVCVRDSQIVLTAYSDIDRAQESGAPMNSKYVLPVLKISNEVSETLESLYVDYVARLYDNEEDMFTQAVMIRRGTCILGLSYYPDNPANNTIFGYYTSGHGQELYHEHSQNGSYPVSIKPLDELHAEITFDGEDGEFTEIYEAEPYKTRSW